MHRRTFAQHTNHQFWPKKGTSFAESKNTTFFGAINLLNLLCDSATLVDNNNY